MRESCSFYVTLRTQYIVQIYPKSLDLFPESSFATQQYYPVCNCETWQIFNFMEFINNTDAMLQALLYHFARFGTWRRIYSADFFFPQCIQKEEYAIYLRYQKLWGIWQTPEYYTNRKIISTIWNKPSPLESVLSHLNAIYKTKTWISWIHMNRLENWLVFNGQSMSSPNTA